MGARILIADDHALVRRGLRKLLEAHGHEVVGEATNGREAFEQASALRPDVVLMDLTMPVLSGLAATRLISAGLPGVKVVVLTASDAEDDLFDAVRSGAQGYLLKELEPDWFFELLERIMLGEPAFTPRLARRLLGEFTRPSTTPGARREDQLTQREQEVLELLVQGVTTDRELAERLFVSQNTVKYHLHNILTKLHLRNRAQVVSYALRHGLASPPDGLDRPSATDRE